MDSFNLSLENIQKVYLKKKFLKNMYIYYINKGYYNIIYTHLTIILTGFFLILYTIFLYNCIDWKVIVGIERPTQIYNLIYMNRFFHFNLFISIFFTTFIVILIFRVINQIGRAHV